MDNEYNEYLKELIENHQRWVNHDPSGIRLTLYGEIISNIDLSNLDLTGAEIADCGLVNVNITNTKLIGVNLSKSRFINSNLTGADLSYSTLRYTRFDASNLEKAIIKYDKYENDPYKILSEIYGADFSLALNLPYLDIPMACPEKGSFIGWKKVFDGVTRKSYIVELEIPEDAKRSSATTYKCRCDKAKVLDIYTLDGESPSVNKVVNGNFHDTKYIVGEMVYPDSFDENRFDECSNGIHFFMDKDMALNY